jgi:hypothetical protein
MTRAAPKEQLSDGASSDGSNRLEEQTWQAPRKERRLPGDALAIALLLGLCVFIGWPRFRSGLELGDEGFLAYGAARVLDGQMPHRDFVSLQPPLSFYTAAAMFKVFGTSLLSLRFLGLFLYCLIPLLIYGISRQLNGLALGLASAIPATILGLPYFQFVPYAAWQGIVAALVAALLFLRATLGRSPLFALPAGLLTAATLLLRQDQGLYLALALLAYALGLKHARDVAVGEFQLKRVLTYWLAGLGVLLLPLGLFWALQGAWPFMLNQLVVFPLTSYAKTSSSPFPAFRSVLAFGPAAYGLLYYFAPMLELVMAVGLIRLMFRRRFSLAAAKLLFIVIWSALFYCQVLARSDLCHLLITLPPFFILCACAFRIASAWLSEWFVNRAKGFPLSEALRFIAPGVAGALVVGFLLLLCPALLGPAVPPSETVRVERAGVRVPGAENVKELVESVQRLAPPASSILCLPYQPMFYFLCERRNPTRWNYLWPGDQTPAEQQALIQQARRDPPAVVLTTAESDMQAYAPAVLDYVHREYKLAGDAGGGLVRIYVPGSTSPGAEHPSPSIR